MKLTFATATAIAALAIGVTTVVTANAAEWPMPNGDYSNTHYSQLDQINKYNVSSLTPAGTLSIGVSRGLESSPLVIGDTMFTDTQFPSTYALDLSDIPVMCCDTVDLGVAYADRWSFQYQANITQVALPLTPSGARDERPSISNRWRWGGPIICPPDPSVGYRAAALMRPFDGGNGSPTPEGANGGKTVLGNGSGNVVKDNKINIHVNICFFCLGKPGDKAADDKKGSGGKERLDVEVGPDFLYRGSVMIRTS